MSIAVAFSFSFLVTSVSAFTFILCVFTGKVISCSYHTIDVISSFVRYVSEELDRFTLTVTTGK